MDPVDVEDQALEASRGRIRTIPALNNTHDRPRDERVQRSAPLHATIPTSRNTNTSTSAGNRKQTGTRGGEGGGLSLTPRHPSVHTSRSHNDALPRAQSDSLYAHRGNARTVCAGARRAAQAGPERAGTSRARPGSRWRALVGHITSLCCGGTEAPFTVPWRL